ncbi:hypothetical protein M5K25_007808 [Dendrobium thyrsiflorum]|uniref:Uncharacterized protein n=1 Tax=Dendrobium thyrsiflorum TaxID=117978 RepID=A0ABD0VG78_DENTH
MIGHESRCKIKLATSKIKIGIIRTPISANLHRIERLDETNLTSPRTQKSDISKSPEPELEEIKGEIEDRSCPLAPPRPPPDHRSKALHFAGPPPDHQPKALHSAGPPAEGPTLRRTTAGPPAEGPTLRRTTAGPPPEGPTLRSRPEVQPKALHPAQGPKFSLRPYSPFKARSPA